MGCNRKCLLCESTRRGKYVHKIPSFLAHRVLADKWLDFLNLRPTREWVDEGWKSIHLCSLHFAEECYPSRLAERVRVTLIIGSVPTENPPSSFSCGMLHQFRKYKKPDAEYVGNTALSSEDITKDFSSEGNIINNICRICGLRGSTLSLVSENSQEKDVGSIPVVNLLEMYLSLQISEDDPFLAFICSDCSSTLNKWHQLYTSFVAVEKVLKHIYGENTNKVKYSEEPSYCESSEKNITSFSLHLNNSKDKKSIRDVPNVRNKTDEKVTNSVRDILPQKEPTQEILKVPQVFVCRYCNAPFLQKVLYKEHRKLCRENTSLCEKCGKLFPKWNCLARHKYVNHNENLTMCEKCGKCVQSGKLYYHNKTKHSFTHNQPLYCDLCCLMFKTLHVHKKHMIRHARGVIKPCLDINCLFKKGGPHFVCPLCHQEFRDKLTIIKHLNQPIFCKCSSCHSRFNNKKGLLIHKCRNWTCMYCFKNFNQHRKCTEHERIHTGERPYECRFCRASFRTIRARSVHYRSHRPPSHECKYCAKKLRSAASLKIHLNNHEGVFNVVCVVCNKRFSGRSALNKHRRKNHSRKEKE